MQHYLNRPLLSCLLSILLLACQSDTLSDVVPAPTTTRDAGTQAVPRSVALSQVRGEASVEDCPNGGVLVEFGVDLNGDGELDADEVRRREPICNGQNGADGTNGNDGSDGRDGQDAAEGPLHLIDFDDEPAGDNCAEGGIAIHRGVDENRNGKLDPDEVTETAYICSGGASTSTTVVSAPAEAGDFCETEDGSGFCVLDSEGPTACTELGGTSSLGGCGTGAKCCVDVGCRQDVVGQCLGGGAVDCATTVIPGVCPGPDAVLCCPEVADPANGAFCETPQGEGFCIQPEYNPMFCESNGGTIVNSGCEGGRGYQCCVNVQCEGATAGTCIGGSALTCANRPINGVCAGVDTVLCCPSDP